MSIKQLLQVAELPIESDNDSNAVDYDLPYISEGVESSESDRREQGTAWWPLYVIFNQVRIIINLNVLFHGYSEWIKFWRR